MSHIFIVPSVADENKNLPLLDSTTLVTIMRWPAKVFMHFPLLMSHIFIVLSQEAENKHLSSLEHTTLLIRLV